MFPLFCFLLAPMSKEPFCPDIRTFAHIGLSVRLLRAAIWILQPLILVWRSQHCAEPAEISEKVDIRAAVLTYHTCSCCNVSPLAVRGLPLCLCGACACVCCFAHSVNVSCAPVYVVSRVSVVSLKCDVIILWWWKVDFVQVWCGGGERERRREGEWLFIVFYRLEWTYIIVLVLNCVVFFGFSIVLWYNLSQCWVP